MICLFLALLAVLAQSGRNVLEALEIPEGDQRLGFLFDLPVWINKGLSDLCIPQWLSERTLLEHWPLIHTPSGQDHLLRMVAPSVRNLGACYDPQFAQTLVTLPFGVV